MYIRPGLFEVIAHRGGALEAPENTFAAFDHALQLHNDIIFELDVQQTRDGQVVVLHDSTVDRTTNGHGDVTDLNYSDVEKLDAAYRFSKDLGKTFPLGGKRIKIPLFKDVLEKYPKTRISVEIKRANPPFERKVIDIIDRFEARDRVVLAGEDHKILSRARKLAPNMESGFSAQEVYRMLISLKCRMAFLAPTRGNVFQIPMEFNGRTIYSEDFVMWTHKLKRVVHLWTINDEVTMRQLLNDGVDGIITDAPSLLLRVAHELKKL